MSSHESHWANFKYYSNLTIDISTSSLHCVSHKHTEKSRDQNKMEGTTALVTALKGILASVSLVGGTHIFLRSPFQQRRSIRKALKAAQQNISESDVYKAYAQGPFPRTASIKRLLDLLASPPKGPIVVTGAEGTGTSSVTGAALAQNDAPMLLRLNLKENPPSGKRPFIRALMGCSGYFTRQREAVDLGMLQGDSEAGLEYDVMTFFTRLTEVLQAEKVARDKDTYSLNRLWRGLPSKERPLPVVFIDELHSHPSLNHTDSDFATFLRWAMFCTDSQLAHVLLVARPERALAIENGLPEFRAMRQRLVINYPSAHRVRDYLVSEAGNNLPSELVERVVETIGGELKNLRLVAHTVQQINDEESPEKRIMACERLLDNLVADSRELVLSASDKLVDEGHMLGNSRAFSVAAYKRALRFWKMAHIIAERGQLPRHELVGEVFGSGSGTATQEIEEYVAARLLTYCSPSESQYNSFGTPSGELWVSAASPLIRGAFKSLCSDDSVHRSNRAKVEADLAKHELSQREAQLSKRRHEQSIQKNALAELLKVSVDGDEELELRRMTNELCIESRATVSELRVVRQEYDAQKWKGRWKV